ncbi:unnamed protein product [Prunus armeniaca]
MSVKADHVVTKHELKVIPGVIHFALAGFFVFGLCCFWILQQPQHRRLLDSYHLRGPSYCQLRCWLCFVSVASYFASNKASEGLWPTPPGCGLFTQICFTGIEEEREGRSKVEGSRSEYSLVRLFAQTFGAFIESTSYTQRVLKESVPHIFQSTEAFQTTMVGSKRTRSKTAAMAQSVTAQSHSTHDPAINMVAPPPLATVPPTGPATESSNLRGTAAEHGGTSHQGGLVTTTDLGPVLEQLQAFPPLPPRSTHALAYTSSETLARVQLGSTRFSPPDPQSQADLNLRVDQLAQRVDDQNALMRQLLNQISVAQNLGLGQPGEVRRIDKHTGGQLNGHQAGRAGASRQGDAQPRDQLADMSRASASHTQSNV